MLPPIRIAAAFALATLPSISIGGCSSTGKGGGSNTEPCGTTTHRISVFGGPGDTRATLADITGDGRPDVVSIRDVGPSSYQLEVGDGGQSARVGLPGEASYLVSLGTVDLDADGQGDLALGLLWHNRVLVFRGPLADDLDEGDAFLSIAGPPDDGGLAPLYGSAVLVADVNGDGARDVVVSSPAEREEGCLGQLAPRVYLGPFVAGSTRDEMAVTAMLAGPMGCLGESLSCTDDGFSATAVPTTVCYSFPLGSDEPVTCP